MIKGVTLVVLLSLYGCSATSLLKAVNPLDTSNGISATAQIGKENQSDSSKQLVKSNVDQKTNYNAEQIGVVDNSTNVPWWAMVLSLFVGILVRPINFIKDWRNVNEPSK